MGVALSSSVDERKLMVLTALYNRYENTVSINTPQIPNLHGPHSMPSLEDVLIYTKRRNGQKSSFTYVQVYEDCQVSRHLVLQCYEERCTSLLCSVFYSKVQNFHENALLGLVVWVESM